MLRVTSQVARKDYPPDIKKGDRYYKWKFRYRGVQRSLKYPKRSQLTTSDFLSQLYDLEDDFEFDPLALEESIEEYLEVLNELADQCQESLDNMPDQLIDTSPAAILLQERIDTLEGMITEIESVEIEDRPADEVIEEIQSHESGL